MRGNTTFFVNLYKNSVLTMGSKLSFKDCYVNVYIYIGLQGLTLRSF